MQLKNNFWMCLMFGRCWFIQMVNLIYCTLDWREGEALQIKLFSGYTKYIPRNVLYIVLIWGHNCKNSKKTKKNLKVYVFNILNPKN